MTDDDDDWTAEQIGALIRQCFVADEGRQLVSADFSQIEARVLLWLAGDEEGLEVFRRFDAGLGPDVYCVAATKMFGEPIVKEDPRRQAGKVAVLSCLAAGTQVVTDSGLKAIERVLPGDRLWDGVEWVTHDGLVERGSRECMNLHGVWLTGDHLVLSETGWKRADTPDLSPAWCSAPSEWSGSFSALQEGSTSRSAYALAGLRLSQLLRTSVRATPPDAAIAPGAQAIPLPARPTATRPSSLTLNCGERGLDGSPQLSPGAKTLATEGGRTTEAEGSEFTGRGFETAVGSCATSLVSTAGWISPENSTGSTTTGDTSLGISEWPLALSSAATPGSPEVGVSKEPASGAAGPFSRPSGSAATAGSRARVELPTFDLLNAGPRSRFALACGLIVHNCGFAAGPDAVDRFAAKNAINLADAGTTSLAVVEGWRRATPLVAGREIGKTFVDEKGRERQVRRGGLWRELESAARDAIQGGDGSPWWRFDGTDLYLLLPSGRAMRYRHARVEAHEKHGKVKDTILFFNPEKNRRVATYGGKLTENLVQAVARDLLADAMVRVEEVAPIVMHTHDNIVAESDRPEEHLAEILQIMTTPPAWAAGLPVGADGHFGRRFTK